MRALCYYACPFFLLTPYVDTATAADVPLNQDPDSGINLDERELWRNVADRYADDIYAQSGGIRLRYDDNLHTGDGQEVYKQFLIHERRAQRAFIWHKLNLRDITFIHADDASLHDTWGVRTKPSQSIASLVRGNTATHNEKLHYEDLLSKFPVERYPQFSQEHVSGALWDIDHLPVFFDNVRHQPHYNDWPNSAAMARPADSDEARAYNDPRFRESDAVVNYRANLRDVVTERLRLFPVESTCNKLINCLARTVRVVSDRQSDTVFLPRMILTALEENSHGADTFNIEINVDTLLRYEGAPEDVYKRIYTMIDKHIERLWHVEGWSLADATKVLQEIADAETARANTYKNFNLPWTHLTPTLGALQLDSSNDPLGDNIERVYRRALVRREEFHKLTDVVVVNAHGPTYRVHYADFESRYTLPSLSTSGRKSKRWYQLTWARLLEPMFKTAVIDDFHSTALRNIVLVHANQDVSGMLSYVVNDMGIPGEDIIIHCDMVDVNHAQTERVIQRQYEAIVHLSTNQRTRQLFAEMEQESNPGTLTLETLERRRNVQEDNMNNAREVLDYARAQLHKAQAQAVARARARYGGVRPVVRQRHHEGGANDLVARASDAFERAQQRLEVMKAQHMRWEAEINYLRTALRTSSFFHTYNFDNTGGFSSIYARKNVMETVIHQRYAMRCKVIRIALLRRMSLYQTKTHAARVKAFYDAARSVMAAPVAPRLYAEWGEFYDNAPPELWGLRAGESPRLDRHYQVMALDTTLATKMASEDLAADLLQRGYHVAMMGYTREAAAIPGGLLASPIPMCTLRSNLHYVDISILDALRIKSTLHLVGGSKLSAESIAEIAHATLSRYTRTGDVIPGGHAVPFVHEVSFVRSPHDPYGSPEMTSEKFQTSFRTAFSAFHGVMAPTISMHDGVQNGVPLWTQEKNLYRDTIYAGWFDGEREVVELDDLPALTYCRSLGD